MNLWFHTIKDGKINHQGNVIEARGTKFLVQLYSWITGCATDTALLDVNETEWIFYNTDLEMRKAIKREVEK